jgi:hypothetical protein
MFLQNMRYALQYSFARSASQPVTVAEIDSCLESLITDHEGVGIGEYHGAYAYPDFIATRAGFFASLGVSQFITEIIPRAQQHKINQWQDEGNARPLIDFINTRKKANSSYQFQRYWEMFQALHAANIRIHGAAMTPDVETPFSMSRANSEFMMAARSARARLGRDEKLMLYGGRGHFRMRDGEPGVSTELGIPALHLEEGAYALSRGVLSPMQHIAMIPRAADQISYFRGPVTKHRMVEYPSAP